MGRQLPGAVKVVHFTAGTHGLTPGSPQVSTVGPMAPALHTIHQEVEIDAPPQDVFDAMMDQEQHAAFTALEATIDWREGGRFSTCAERNFGYTLALVDGRRIVQAWSHRSFPQHHYTVVTFELEPRGSGTRLLFTQAGVPEQDVAWLSDGWRTTYWEPLQRYFAEAETAA